MHITFGENNANILLKSWCIFPLLFITWQVYSQQPQPPTTKDSLTKNFRLDTLRKSLRQPQLVTNRRDTTVTVTDSLRLPISADSLEGPVKYMAADSGILDIPAKTFILYGSANLKYQTMDLTASVIEIDNERDLAKAFFTRDSTGKVVDRPKMVDGDMTNESDSLFYNFRTQRGLTKSTYTQQGEMFVYAERIKKINATSFFASNGRFTTCNLDTPHFAFRAKKMKVVNKKWAYSGIAYPEFEGVPMPIGIPFGIYPLSQGRHSGILPPTFVAAENFGLGLLGLGYYKVLNDYFDITLRSDIYSYGGYGLHFTPSYRVRYKYNGGFRFDFQKTRIAFKGDPDYSNTNSFNVAWNHSMDSKARPGTNFSASVLFGTSNYNRLQLYNSNLNFSNKINSSIQYSKTWKQGKYNFSAVGSHNQDNQTGLYTVSLPNLNFTVNTLYPFKPKDGSNNKWYHKFGIGYNGQLQNRFSFYNSDTPYRKTSFEKIIDTMQWGAEHRIPLGIALPPLGPINISPGISFSERWYGQKLLKLWNANQKRVDTLVSKGFFPARSVGFSLGFQTAVFGKFNFGKKGKIEAIRHVIRPSISANYTPDLQQKFYYKTQVDTSGRQLQFNVFDGGLYTPFAPGSFGGMNFGIQNQLEMKVRNRKDTTGENRFKKVSLIDNLSFTSGYNFLSDSFQLQPISVVFSTTLFQKINISGGTSVNPYQTNNRGDLIDKYVWNGGKWVIGNMIRNASFSIGANFTSRQQEKKDQEAKEAQSKEQYDPMVTPEELMAQQDYVRQNPGEYADFSIPWSLSVNYALSYSSRQKPDYSGYITDFTSNINMQGDFKLSPKWKLGASMFYDVINTRVGSLTMFLSRELHCWQMSINVVPIGYTRTFNISISPRSNILRDLKVNRTRVFYN